MSAIATSMAVEVTGLSKGEQELLAAMMTDIRRSVDGIRRAAGRWLEFSPRARALIVEQTRPCMREFWGRLERVGAGELHPQLATVSGLAARYLGRLPVGDQEKFLAEGIPVVSATRSRDVRLVDVVMMSEEQRKQVFKACGSGVLVRSVEEQKAWLADQAARRLLRQEAADSLKRVERVGWTVDGGRVFIKPARVESGLTLRDVRTMLRDLGE